MNPKVPSAKPLSGLTIMVTRASHQAGGLADLLAPLGAEVVLQPAIEIVETANWSQFDRAMAQFEAFSRVVLVSANAASFFFSRLQDPALPEMPQVADLARVEFAAIGLATAAIAAEHGVCLLYTSDAADE